MELAQITAGQVVMLFLLIGTGIAAVKTGVLKPEGKQTLSNLLVYLVVPAMIVNSYRMEFSMEILRNLLAAILIPEMLRRAAPEPVSGFEQTYYRVQPSLRF